jgi:hypothetical protein
MNAAEPLPSPSPEHRGELGLDDPGRYEAACAIAWALAESGVREVQVSDGGRARPLAARETDLPRVILSAAPGSVLAWDRGALTVGEGGRSIEWRTRDSAVHAALAALS